MSQVFPMSVNESQADESGVTNEQVSASEANSEASISFQDALAIQRKANARQSPSRSVDDAAVGPNRSVEGSSEVLDGVFNEDGMAFEEWWEYKRFDNDGAWSDSFESGEIRRPVNIHPGEVEVSTTESESIFPDEDPEAYLEEVAPDIVKEVDEKLGGLPGSRDQLLLSQAHKVADERDEECVHIEQESDEQDGSLVFTTHQQSTTDKFAHLDRENDTQDGQACPECESTNTSSYQQQTGSADEGMTSFHKCADCSHSWRGGYGG